MIQVFDRARKKIFIEKVYGAFWVDVFYSKLSLPIFHWRPVQIFLSHIVGLWNSTPFSVFQIKKFVQEYNVDLRRFTYPKGGFKSFNQFFIRKYKEEFCEFPVEYKLLGSPCEARVSAYYIENLKSRLVVKGEALSLEELLLTDRIEEHFEGGTAVVFRLCPADYHRFHFPDYATIKKISKIKGNLFSVNPKALEMFPKIFLKNERCVTEMQTQTFGKIYYIEVGALCVGKIVQTFGRRNKVNRGEEKGYFEFGASTIILLLQAQIKVSSDLLENTKKGVESLVRLGEVIAKSPGGELA